MMASMRNCVSTSRPCAPTASRMPISRVRSVTDTSMMFMTPIPPTSNEIPATPPSITVIVRLVAFAVSTSEKETDPSRVMQLAVDRQGIISGTLYNTSTDQTQAIQGQVDKETQRVAFRIGDNENVVAETGLYNLTQSEAQLLVHYGTERTETFLLVRLDAPPEDGAAADNTTGAAAPAQ